jgi:hypothetical protein
MLIYISSVPNTQPFYVKFENINDTTVFEFFVNYNNESLGVSTATDAAQSNSALDDIYRYNSLWLRSELAQVRITHPLPPLLLQDVQMLKWVKNNQCYEDVSIDQISVVMKNDRSIHSNNKSNFIVAHPDFSNSNRIYNTTAYKSCAIPLLNKVSNVPMVEIFDAHFTEQTLEGTAKHYQVTIYSNESWQESCVSRVRDQHNVTDKLKIFLSCALIGIVND